MKRLMTTLAVMVMIVTSAAAMSLSKARTEALFLSDKMAYELSLSLSQYEAVYEINLDYMLGLYDADDLGGVFWLRRNVDLRYVLSPWQWDRYVRIADFYRPMVWVSRHTFSLVLRSRYTYRDHFFFDRPAIYGSYRGGHNAGHESYYAGRDFHRPSNKDITPQHYGSSAPPAYGSGSTRGNRHTQPSYHFNNKSNTQINSHQEPSVQSGRSVHNSSESYHNNQRGQSTGNGQAAQTAQTRQDSNAQRSTKVNRSTENSSRSVRGASKTNP
ncbi:MAG: hypothetical protein K6C30_03885 [Bacteroidaceae bacterium]|nr:hypothetical protein [Bacteroidaceae bacterium]